jgi:hypothetical protein
MVDVGMHLSLHNLQSTQHHCVVCRICQWHGVVLLPYVLLCCNMVAAATHVDLDGAVWLAAVPFVLFQTPILHPSQH